MLKLAAEAYRRMPWKNGGGVTLEIAVAPAGAGLYDFEWRISSAHVEVAGPFSTFPGIDRSLALLGGAGMDLVVDGRRAALAQDGPVCAFDGGAAARAELPVGPVTDFNVMSRRGRWTHRLTRMRLDTARELQTDADVALLYCASGRLTVRAEGYGPLVLEVGDALQVEGVAPLIVQLAPSGAVSLLVAELSRGARTVSSR
ncbi:HutD family protein [Aromatoleum toluclasticum]|uniref:HutD/Ves family protein n=1 Tax=Aromatoleum toluclasticum TaxID=92003 RepID=UPI000378D5FC|nr:HutD family protein [Aromatoleum toluclasticum]MCC4116901.1 HutD family protein [Aromatoleum toluclasticum]